MKNLLFIFPLLLLLACNSEPTSEAEKDDDRNEVETSLIDLPSKITTDITSRFPAAELLEADQLLDDNGNTTYEVQFKHNGRIMEARYMADGRFLGVEVEGPAEESDDDDDL